jgi:hypothetical protein
MPRLQVIPCNVQCDVQYQLCELGQAVAYLHDRERLAEVGDSDPELRSTLKFRKGFHATLAVKPVKH